jgi:membrane protein YqaA with SNARE-associated domain
MNYFILLISALISATLIPFGSEALLVLYLENGYNLYLLLFFATIGNTLGSIINYFLGLKGEEYLINKKILKEKRIIKTKKYFDKYGSFCLLFSWLPIIGDPITLIAGVLKYNFKKFIIFVFIAKFLRYLSIILIYIFSFS